MEFSEASDVTRSSAAATRQCLPADMQINGQRDEYEQATNLLLTMCHLANLSLVTKRAWRN